MVAILSTSVDPTGPIVVRLNGELDISERDYLDDVLEAALLASRHVVVDLSAVTFLDSAALSGLVLAHRDALRLGGQITLTGLAERDQESLRMMRLGLLIPVYDSIDGALAALGP